MAEPIVARIAHALRQSGRRQPDVPDADHDLLARFVTARDEAAFRALVNRHGRTVLAACRQVLTDPADVDDAFQAAFLVLLRKAKAVDSATPLGGWLFAVAHRVAVRCRSDNARRRAREAEAAKRAATAGEPADLSWREAVAVLHAELNALPDKYRLPLLLCGVQGLTRDEAADQLGTTVGAVRGQLERGRALLERRLTKRGIVPSVGLLAVLLGGSRSAGGPSAELIDLAVRATAGNASSAVAALARGAFPMTTTLTRILLPAVLAFGLLGAGAGAGLQPPAARPDDKPKGGMTKPKGDPKPVVADERTITGTVVGPDGKPVRAELTLHWLEGTVQPLGRTKEDSTFRVTVPMQRKGLGAELLATAAGCGPDFHDHGIERKPASVTPTADFAFKLPKERVIKGRVISQEGKPVAGATVAAFAVSSYDSPASLDARLKRWAERADGNPLHGDRGFQYPKAAKPPSAATDADGRFELAGFGDGQTVELKLTGDGLAVKGLVCVNRDGFDPAPLIESAVRNAGRNHKFNARWLPCGPDFATVVEPEKLLRGTVTGHDGKPRAGARVQATRTTSSELTDHWYWHEATTDPDGRYVIRGVRKYAEYMVEVDGDVTTGQLPSHASAKDTVGYEPITLDAKSERGVIVTGTLTDKATGRPHRGDVRAAVLADNPFVKQYPTFLHPGSDGQSREWVDPDGRFRLVTIPGPVLLVARSGRRDDSEFRRPVPDPDYPQYFGDMEGMLQFKKYRGGNDLLNGCWCKVLNAKAAGDEVAVKIELEPATKTLVKVVDADGKPVAGVKATGVNYLEYSIPTAFPDTDTLTVFNLDAKKGRVLAVVHEGRKLVGTLTLTAGTRDPVVKLGAGGTLTGRAVGKDGKPLVGLTIETRFTHRPATEAFKALHNDKLPTTDANGEFRVDGLFPGREFKLFYTRDRRSYGLEVDPTPAYTLAKPGEVRTAGELVLLVDHQ